MDYAKESLRLHEEWKGKLDFSIVEKIYLAAIFLQIEFNLKYGNIVKYNRHLSHIRCMNDILRVVF